MNRTRIKKLGNLFQSKNNEDEYVLKLNVNEYGQPYGVWYKNGVQMESSPVFPRDTKLNIGVILPEDLKAK